MTIYNFSCITGCGNLYSTTEDLYKYDRGITNQELIVQESLDTIFTPYGETGITDTDMVGKPHKGTVTKKSVTAAALVTADIIH